MSAANDGNPDETGESGYTAKGERRQFVKHSYTDYASEEDGPLSKKDEAILSQYDENRVGGPFPLKLHIILKILEKEGNDDVFSWLPHGRSFGIHKPGQFEEVIKRFFRQSQISSFRRQLNLYGFLRLTNGRDSGSYYHELFLRSKPLLSLRMTRTRIKGTKIRASSSPADEPRLYSFPVLGPVERPERLLAMQDGRMPLIQGQQGMVAGPRDEREILAMGGMRGGEAGQYSIVGPSGAAAAAAGPRPRTASEAAYLNQMRANMQPDFVQMPSNADPMFAQMMASRSNSMGHGGWAGPPQQNLSQSLAQSKANYFNAIHSMGSGTVFPHDGMASTAMNPSMMVMPSAGVDMMSHQNMAQQRYVEELERTVAIQNMERQGLMNSIAASSMARIQQSPYMANSFPMNGMVVANQVPAYTMLRAAGVPAPAAGVQHHHHPDGTRIVQNVNVQHPNNGGGSQVSRNPNGRNDKDVAAAMLSMGTNSDEQEDKTAEPSFAAPTASNHSSSNVEWNVKVQDEEDNFRSKDNDQQEYLPSQQV